VGAYRGFDGVGMVVFFDPAIDCDLGLAGGLEPVDETQKMVNALILKAQCEAELSATRQPFQKN